MDEKGIVRMVFKDPLDWIAKQHYTLVGVCIYTFAGTYISYTSLSKELPFSPDGGFISLIPSFLVFPSGTLVLLIACVLFIIFFQRLKYPRTPRLKANIYFAIHDVYETSESKKYLEKIYKSLDIEITKCDTEKVFHVSFLNQHLSKAVLKREREILESGKNGVRFKWYDRWPIMPDIIRTNYTLLIYGKLVAAQDGEEETYKIEPEYIVRHRPIPTHQSQAHSQRFKRYLDSQKWSFPKSKEMDALTTVPDNFKQHVLYAIGMSAHFSNLIKIALGIHKELLQIIEPKLQSAQYLKTLKANVIDAVVMEAQMLAGFYSSENDLDKAEYYYLESAKFKPDDYQTNLNLAALYYSKDPSGNLHKDQVYFYLNEAKKRPGDASFKLSDGFLKIFWENNISEGIDLYIQALRKGKINGATIKGTYDWLCKREAEDKILIDTLKGLILYYRLDPEKGVTKLNEIKTEIRETKQNPILLEKLEKILPN